MVSRPSFDLKLDRAEQHLVELEQSIAAYTATHPYAVRPGRPTKSKPNPYRLTFTSQPDEMLDIIVGDFIHNIRSGLDHLAAALVPGARRSKTMFPIMWPGVWEPVVPGENEQRSKDRLKWNSFTHKMDPAAVAILQQLQPDAPGGDTVETHTMPGLAALSRLSNHDKHSKLVVVAVSLTLPHGHFTIDEKVQGFGVVDFQSYEALSNDAEFVMPEGAVDVQLFGTPRVVVRISHKDIGYLLPEVFQMLLRDTRKVIDVLRPYVVRP